MLFDFLEDAMKLTKEIFQETGLCEKDKKAPARCQQPGGSCDYVWGTCRFCGGEDPSEAEERRRILDEKTGK